MSKKEAVQEDDLDFEDDAVGGAETDDDVDFVVEEDDPEEDRGRPRADDTSEDDDIFDDDELRGYSKEVQKRVDVLTKKRHDERRAKEDAFRERDAALAIANQARNQSLALQQRLNQSSQAAVVSTKASALAEVDTVRGALRDAAELGDGEKVAELTVQLTRAVNKLDSAEAEEARLKANPQNVQVDVPAVNQQQPVFSDRHRAWLARNKWFDANENPRAFGYAMGLHEELKRKGVALESDAYYNTIDREVSKHFPDLLSKSSNNSRSSTPPVSGVTRRSASGKPVIHLTKSELRVCKRMNISPKEYAKEKASGDSADV